MTLRDKVRSFEIRRVMNVEPHLLRIERSQLRCFSHVSRMPHNRLIDEILRAMATEKLPRGHPWTRWNDYISDLASSRLGVEPAGLSEIPVDREVPGVLFEQLSPSPSFEEMKT